MKPGSTHWHWHESISGCVLVVLLAATSHGYRAEQNLFDVVPQPLRTQLVERLNRYIEYQRTKQYGKLYDLYSKTTIDRIFKNQTREEFVAAFNKGDQERISVTIIEFTPIRVEKTTKENVDWYNIYGQAKLCQQGKLVEGVIMVGAQLGEGVWHFSALTDIVEN